MDFTFGIITSGENDPFITEIIESIVKNNIPNYEIIIVGNTKIRSNPHINIEIFEFDETIKKGWITKKKNIIALKAKYENIVLLHDYVKLGDNWYSGFLKFGDDYEWCVTKIINKNGKRFRDYTLFPYVVDHLKLFYSAGGDIDGYYNHQCLLPYDFKNTIKTNKYMYISGAYYVIKKTIAMKHLLDENLTHSGGEDVEYSKRLHSKGIIIKCNPYSDVLLLKQKSSADWEKRNRTLLYEKFIDYCEKTFNNI